jgi:hypothetical protein
MRTLYLRASLLSPRRGIRAMYFPNLPNIRPATGNRGNRGRDDHPMPLPLGDIRSNFYYWEGSHIDSLDPQSGINPCFLCGRQSRLVDSASKASAT